MATISGGIALFFLFIVHESRSDHPMLDVALFRNPRFTAASGSVAVSFFALQGFIFLVTQYFQFIKTFSPLGTGVRLLPVAGSVAVASVIGTKLAVSNWAQHTWSGVLLHFAPFLRRQSAPRRGNVPASCRGLTKRATFVAMLGYTVSRVNSASGWHCTALLGARCWW